MKYASRKLIASISIVMAGALVGVAACAASSQAPVCSNIGTRSEGWYSTPVASGSNALIVYAQCSGCTAVCKEVGTRSEGWYNSCDGSLIEWAQCGSTEPIVCTMEAKLCPDGIHYVSRDPKNHCEFSQCPAADACAPYQCNDGTKIDRCTADGHVINYFAAPCLTHGGEVDTSCEGQCRPAMGMPNWQCSDGSMGGPVCERNSDGQCAWSVHQCASTFTDVPATHPNADAIAYVKAQGIVSGYPDGTFRPDQTINRAEFTKIIISTLPEGQGTDCGLSWISTGSPFSDVRLEDWFAGFVCVARQKGIINGYGDSTFRPAQNINFAEAAKIISNAFALPVTQADIWYEGYVRALANENAIPTSIIRFDQAITRGEMAEIIWRLRAGVTAQPSQSYENLR